jgi:hypothetical protein
MQHATFIAQRKEQLLDIRNLLGKHFYFADETLMQLSPGPKQWRIVEHLAHINLANYHYLDQLPKAFNSKSTSHANAQIKRTTLGRLLIWGMGTNKFGKAKFKLPAPKKFIPISVLHPESKLKDRAVFEDFLTSLDLVENLLEGMPEKQFKALKLETAIGKWPKLNLYDTLLIMEIHTLRHLKKMIEIKEATF